MSDQDQLRASAPYAAPMAIFLALLWLGPKLGLGIWEYPVRDAILAVTLWVFSRHVIQLRPLVPVASIVVGVAVFFLWIAPDSLIPGWRSHAIFQNSITGKVASSIDPVLISSPVVLIFRTIRAALLVPIIEELFWRGWLMRWLINTDFQKVKLGAYTASSFVITALLFASEHGPFWEVGLLTGVIYNAWMIRTKSLADCILVHAVTNLVLSLYVIGWGKWEFWM